MKSNYLNNLEREFYFVSDEEREQIIGEYQVHFEERIKDGVTEAEVINNLGSPKTVAIEYANELDIKYSTIEKQIANFKRDSNIYIKSLKRKMAEVKNQEAAKRKNRKQYSIGDFNGQTDTNIDNSNNNPTLSYFSRFMNTIKNMIKSIIKFLIRIWFLLLVLFNFIGNLFINFSAFIIGIGFGLNVLIMIVIGIMMPIFVTFTDFKVIIWFLIYGSIFSLIVFFATISVLCLKRFGRLINE